MSDNDLVASSVRSYFIDQARIENVTISPRFDWTMPSAIGQIYYELQSYRLFMINLDDLSCDGIICTYNTVGKFNEINCLSLTINAAPDTWRPMWDLRKTWYNEEIEQAKRIIGDYIP